MGRRNLSTSKPSSVTRRHLPSDSPPGLSHLLKPSFHLPLPLLHRYFFSQQILAHDIQLLRLFHKPIRLLPCLLHPLPLLGIILCSLKNPSFSIPLLLFRCEDQDVIEASLVIAAKDCKLGFFRLQ